MWEKVLGVHEGRYILRVIARIPIACLLWFLALLIPFFGPLNSLIGAFIMSFSVYIIPCIAYLIVFKNPKSREVYRNTSSYRCKIFLYMLCLFWRKWYNLCRMLSKNLGNGWHIGISWSPLTCSWYVCCSHWDLVLEVGQASTHLSNNLKHLDYLINIATAHCKLTWLVIVD